MAGDAGVATASQAGANPRYAPPDPTLPAPWRGLIDGATGYLYYWNPVTNATQYERPSGSANGTAVKAPIQASSLQNGNGHAADHKPYAANGAQLSEADSLAFRRKHEITVVVSERHTHTVEARSFAFAWKSLIRYQARE